MAHRGPDDEGYVLVRSNGVINTFRGDRTPVGLPEARSIPGYPTTHIDTVLDAPSMIALGHRRLAILDLSPQGHQPMCTPDWRYWIVFNGEIYNYQDLKQLLEKERVSFHSRTDTEVLLYAYLRWGEKCLDLMNGDFAFAIWDNRERSLICARDRIGIKPFYYTFQNGLFIFASDIKTIIASGFYRPKPDPEGLYLAMAFGIAPRPLTAFEGINALEQGHWMKVYSDGRIEKQCWWQIPVGTVQPNMREDEAFELLQEKLTAAVLRRLVSDVPVGTFMSGGIDSTTITAIAARLHHGIKAFTLGYGEIAPELDEVLQAMAAARMLPLQHIVHRVDPAACLADLDAWVAGYEEPFYSLPPNYVIAGVAKQNHVTVVLNGLGGDELFAGYDYYKRIALWRTAYHLAPMAQWVGCRLGRRGRYLARIAEARTADRFHTAAFMKFGEDDLHALFPQNPLQGVSVIEKLHQMYARGRVFADEVDAISFMDMMNYIGNHHVHRVDQFTMAFSLESRFPFLDHEVVELAFRMPARLKMRKGVQKYILRKVAATQIPSECLSMKKKGFALPVKQWMEGPLKPLVLKLIAALKQRPMTSPDAIERFFTEYQNGDRPASQIWHLVALELWFQRFIDRSSRT